MTVNHYFPSLDDITMQKRFLRVVTPAGIVGVSNDKSGSLLVCWIQSQDWPPGRLESCPE